MPVETAQTRALRSELASVDNDARRNAERRQHASARSAKARAEAVQIADHLRSGSVEMLMRDARDWVARYRNALGEVANQESTVLSLLFEQRVLEKKHTTLKTALEAAVRAAGEPAGARR